MLYTPNISKIRGDIARNLKIIRKTLYQYHKKIIRYKNYIMSLFYKK